MSAYDAWMSLQMKAISGDAAAAADIEAVAAELGDHPTDAERAEVWQRMLQERAQKEEEPKQPDEPRARRPRLNTEDIEEVHHDDEGLPQMRMVNDKAPDGLMEGGVLVCDPCGVEAATEEPMPANAEKPDVDDETDAEEIVRDAPDLGPSDAAVQKFALLEPLMTRPREVYYSFKDIAEHQAIIVRPPRFHDGCLVQNAETLTADRATFSERFLEKPKVLRRVHLLKFRVSADASLPELFRLFCDRIRLVPSDFVNMYKIGATHKELQSQARPKPVNA